MNNGKFSTSIASCEVASYYIYLASAPWDLAEAEDIDVWCSQLKDFFAVVAI